MQVHRATGAGRAEPVRAALHAFDREQLRGDAARDSFGKCAARPFAGDHAVSDGERRTAGTGGNERIAADRRSESKNPQYVLNIDEFARKSGSRVNARISGTQRRIPVDSLPQQNELHRPKLCHRGIATARLKPFLA